MLYTLYLVCPACVRLVASVCHLVEPSRAVISCIFDTCATSCPSRQPRHARSGRTKVGSRATSSLSISPCCDTGDRQCGQLGLARCMNGPAHPRHSAECPHSLNLNARGADMHHTHSRSTVSGASAARRCVSTSACSRARASGTVMRRALGSVFTRPMPILCSSLPLCTLVGDGPHVRLLLVASVHNVPHISVHRWPARQGHQHRHPHRVQMGRYDITSYLSVCW